MFESRKELLEKIRLGEDTFLEYKEVRFSGSRITAPERTSLAEGLAAFANSRGGVFLLGVEDKTREIVGIPLDRLELVERFVREVCDDSVEPPMAPVIERLFLPTITGDEAAIIKIEIHRSLFVHQSSGRYFHRVGSAKREMSPDYLARLFQQRSQVRLIRFDEQTVSTATLDDLSDEIWGRFRTPHTGDNRNDVLAKLHLARRDENGSLRPTVAGILMASMDPTKWLPNAFIQAVAYRGTTIRAYTDDPYQLDALDITGPLNEQVEEACRFVARNMKVAAFKDQGRMDRPQFDMGAVLEAVGNAVAHRDYSIHGSKIRLRLFQDRLELYSPGAIPNTMRLQDMPHLQSIRNAVITSLLAKCPVPTGPLFTTNNHRTMMDKRGEGVPVILENSKILSGRYPEYRLIGDAQLLLTIYAPTDQ